MLQLFRFLFTHIVGVSLVAALGASTCCVGNCLGLKMFVSPEKAVEIKLSRLEAGEEPGSRFLVLEETRPFLAEAKTLTITRKTRRTTTETKYLYIPLLSPATFEKWSKAAAQGKYPYEDCRVIVKVEASNRESVLQPGSAIKGRTTPFNKEDKDVVEAMGKNAGPNYDPAKILLLHTPAEPLSAGGGIAAAVCSFFFGVLCLIPLGLVVVKKMSGKKADPAAMRGGIDEAVRGGVEEGFRRAAEAARQPAPAPAPAPAPVRPVEPFRPAPAPAPAPAPVQPAAPPGIAPNVPFHYLKGGQPQGPVPYAALQSMAASGQLSPDDMVWQAGTPNWVPARTVAGLFRG